MKVIEEKNNHMKEYTCDLCGSRILLAPKDIVLRFADEDDVPCDGNAWVKYWDCPNCKKCNIIDHGYDENHNKPTVFDKIFSWVIWAGMILTAILLVVSFIIEIIKR